MAEPVYLVADAQLSDDTRGPDGRGMYRYRLRRIWDLSSPPAVFVLLNPSTADGSKLDPSARRCLGFAQAWGCGGFSIVNLFAYRATYPRHLHTAGIDPVGPENNRWILDATRGAPLVIAAWGQHGDMLNSRADTVKRLLANAGVALSCLRITKEGYPSHPLRLPGDLKPIPYGRRIAA